MGDDSWDRGVARDVDVLGSMLEADEREGALLTIQHDHFRVSVMTHAVKLLLPTCRNRSFSDSANPI